MGNLIIVPCLVFGALMGWLLAKVWPRIEGWWMTRQSDSQARQRLRLPSQRRRRWLLPQIRFPW